MLEFSAVGGLGALLSSFGLSAEAVAHAAQPLANAAWKTYPFSLFPGDANFDFPSVDGVKTAHGTDTWYVDGQLNGASGGKYAFIVIFCKNRIGDIRADFYTFAVFDLQSGDYGTFTEYDFPPANLLAGAPKLSAASDHLDLGFATSAGAASWTGRRDATGALIPFVSQVSLVGTDQRGRSMTLLSIIDSANPPTAVGPDHGYIECFGQQNTGTYFQTAPHFSGMLTWGSRTEPVTGTLGHIDRQWFPEAGFSSVGITARGISHEWRSVNLADGSDLSIWRQFDRTKRNAQLPFTGATRFIPDSAGGRGTTVFAPDVEVDYLSFVKWPDSVGTFVPAPSANRYAPSAHVLRVPSWKLTLTATPTTPVPAHNLPVEYMIGPMKWAGTMAGRSITGFGVSERTLVYYRDWELVEVLRTTVTHLPAAALRPGGATIQSLQSMVDTLSGLVDSGQRVQAVAFIQTHLKPAVTTLADPSKTFLTTLLSDLQTAPSS